MKKVIDKWYWIIIWGFVVFAALVFIICGQNSVIAVPDNLDLFIPQYQMMKNTHSFFSHDRTMGFLFGLDRDYLPSEFNIYTMVFMLLPSYWAYISCYFLKIFISIVGSYLFAKDVFKDKYSDYKPLVLICSFAYGILNLFPNFGIAFASIPVLLFIMHRIVTKPHVGWYLALLAYPLLSYFSYLGIFFIGYLCVYFVYRWIRYKKFPGRILLSIPILFAGYILCEYRLFSIMLFGEDESIRSSMVSASLTGKELLASMWEAFAFGDMHTESAHTYFVMPIVIAFILIETVLRIKKHELKKVFSDNLIGVLLFIIFNSVVYGLNYSEPVRTLFETLLPPLSGFEFGRTQFTNPFLWYLAFFIVLKRLYDYLPRMKWIPNTISVIAVLIIVLFGNKYNDLYSTCYSQYYKLRNNAPSNRLTYNEFYSADLFERAKADINYQGEQSAAYGFYPAVLEYNGIKTVDGYLGYYPDYYKKLFRHMIAPALERVPESKAYFDDWGARCYLFSGNFPSVTNANRDYGFESDELYINTDAFKYLGGRYIFSRLELTNAAQQGFELVNCYTDEGSPYKLYVYKTISRYMDKEISNIPFEDRVVDEVNEEVLSSYINEIEQMALKANEEYENSSNPENYSISPAKEEKLIELIKAANAELDKYLTQYYFLQIKSDMDTTNASLQTEQEMIYEDYLNYYDSFAQSLREVASGPYISALSNEYGEIVSEAYYEYEDMTDEELEDSLKIQSLQYEYTQIFNEDFYYEYEGKQYSLDNFEDAPAEAIPEISANLMLQVSVPAGDIFKQLVELNTKRARNEGYDNYMDFAFANIYNRDYTTDDVKKMCKEIRKRCLIYYMLCEKYINEMAPYDPGAVFNDDTRVFEMLLPYMRDFDSEMGDVMQHMLDCNLYDLKPSETKVDRGYTGGLGVYGDAFIFDSPYMSSLDFATYIHEFGHYNAMYHEKTDLGISVDNIDVSEVHSQALQLLMGPYFEDMISEEEGKYLLSLELYDMIRTIYQSCFVVEFEMYVYENPKESVTDWNREYMRIMRDYGFTPYGDDECAQWVTISHLFYQPGYYISYATSALEALNLYVESLEDYNLAKEKYLQITSSNMVWPFRFAMDIVDLPDIFKPGVSKNIFRTTYKQIRKMAKSLE